MNRLLLTINNFEYVETLANAQKDIKVMESHIKVLAGCLAELMCLSWLEKNRQSFRDSREDLFTLFRLAD